MKVINVECVEYFFDGFCEFNVGDKATVKKENNEFVFIDQDYDDAEYLTLIKSDLNKYFKAA